MKRFSTKDHLVSMLCGVFAKCSSLCEILVAMLVLSGKTKHFQLESLLHGVRFLIPPAQNIGYFCRNLQRFAQRISLCI
ncbi:MAG: hypothetical protein ACK5L7_03610, partial [Paludibacteraceae bacterium]